MLFERFEDKGLAQYSYIVGCPAIKQMAVVDPKRDIDTYLDYAKSHDLTITHVLETHIHADYASGAKALAEQAGATLWASAYDEGQHFEVRYPHQDMFDGDIISIGGVRIEALHTPGHTPEHLSFLIYDQHRASTIPMLMLSGDFLFVGSLGRPDLLGEDAKKALAEKLYDSATQKIAHLPDSLEIHPGHGAGSMCGSGMSGRPMSTLGYERITNPYLYPELSKSAFIEQILENVPPFPDYYKRMKQLNSDGPMTFKNLPGKGMGVAEFKKFVDKGAVVIDLRDQLSFGGGHVPGAFGIGAGGKVSIWASWVVPYDQPLLLIAENQADIEAAVRALIRVGLDDVVGYLEGGMAAWRNEGYPLQSVQQQSPKELYTQLETENLSVLDIRSEDEYGQGCIHDAIHLIGGLVDQGLDQLPDKDEALVVVCDSGYRSTVIASQLQRLGYAHLINLSGGMQAWRSAGLPVETAITYNKPQNAVEA